jgi:hypothetical protein
MRVHAVVAKGRVAVITRWRATAPHRQRMRRGSWAVLARAWRAVGWLLGATAGGLERMAGALRSGTTRTAQAATLARAHAAEKPVIAALEASPPAAVDTDATIISRLIPVPSADTIVSPPILPPTIAAPPPSRPGARQVFLPPPRREEWRAALAAARRRAGTETPPPAKDPS